MSNINVKYSEKQKPNFFTRCTQLFNLGENADKKIEEKIHEPGFTELATRLKEKCQAEEEKSNEINKELCHAGISMFLEQFHLGDESIISKEMCSNINHFLGLN